jgi:hypothetical protein
MAVAFFSELPLMKRPKRRRLDRLFLWRKWNQVTAWSSGPRPGIRHFFGHITGAEPLAKPKLFPRYFKETSVYTRLHPDVDPPAPARPARRAFGFAEFLSLIPNRLKSPRGEGMAIACIDFADERPANPVV